MPDPNELTPSDIIHLNDLDIEYRAHVKSYAHNPHEAVAIAARYDACIKQFIIYVFGKKLFDMCLPLLTPPPIGTADLCALDHILDYDNRHERGMMQTRIFSHLFTIQCRTKYTVTVTTDAYNMTRIYTIVCIDAPATRMEIRENTHVGSPDEAIIDIDVATHSTRIVGTRQTHMFKGSLRAFTFGDKKYLIYGAWPTQLLVGSITHADV